MKEDRDEYWLQDWSCMYDTKGEALLCWRFVPWLISGILILGTIGAVMGAIIGAVVQATGQQVHASGMFNRMARYLSVK